MGVLRKQTSGLFSCREKTVTLTALTKTADDSFFDFGFMLRFCGIWILLQNTLFLWKTLRLDLALRFPNLFLDTQMLAAAQSPPPPLGQ